MHALTQRKPYPHSIGLIYRANHIRQHIIHENQRRQSKQLLSAIKNSKCIPRHYRDQRQWPGSYGTVLTGYARGQTAKMAAILYRIISPQAV